MANYYSLGMGVYSFEVQPITELEPKAIFEDGKNTGKVDPNRLHCMGLLPNGGLIRLSNVSPELKGTFEEAMNARGLLLVKHASLGMTLNGRQVNVYAPFNENTVVVANG